MALSRSDLVRLLEPLRTADRVETIRGLCEGILRSGRVRPGRVSR